MKKHGLLLLTLLIPGSVFADIFITTNTTWDTSVNPRVLNQTVRVQNGAKLTIVPGVIVKPQATTTYIIIEAGALDAQQAIFTSYKDDAHGGDTNGDGGATSPAAGDWANLQFLNGTIDAQTVLNQCQVLYGNGVQVHDASPQFFSTQFQHSTFAAIWMTGASFPNGNGNIAINNPLNGIAINGGTLNQSGTWNPLGFPYAPTGIINIAFGTTLNISSGTIFKMTGGTAFSGPGVMSMLGTPSNPIVFTSIHDDSVGGDTNGNGNTTSPSPGNWNLITIQNTNSILNNVHIRYGEQQPSDGSLRIENGAPIIQSCLIERNVHTGMSIAGNSSPLIQGCTVQFQDQRAIINDTGFSGGAIIRGNLIQHVNYDAIVSHAANGEITGNRFFNNGRHAIYLYDYTSGAGWSPVVANNKFGNNNGAVIHIQNAKIYPQQLNSNVIVSSNGVNGIEVEGNPNLNSSAIWDSANLPFVVVGTLHTDAGTTLTITPGTVVKFSSQSGLRFGGELFAQGTSSNPIVFTSLQDDTYGGNTNVSEGNVNPAPGNWGWVQIRNNSVLSNMIVRYGGAPGGSGSILAEAGTPLIQSVLVEHSLYAGMSVHTSGSPLIQGCTFQFIDQVGLRTETNNTGTPIIRDNLFHFINYDGMWMGGSSAEVRGNTFVNNGRIGINLFSPGGTPIIAENRFGNNNAAVIYIQNPNIFPQQLGTNIIISSNAINGIEVTNGGSTGMTTSGTWDSPTLPFVVRTFVYSNQTLTITPGTVVKLDRNNTSALIINDLVAEGTPQQPVVFTSLRDDSVGGDTNIFEGNVSPAAGDWYYVRADGVNSRVSNAVFNYGGRNNGLLFLRGSGSVPVTRSQFQNSQNSGLFTEESAAPRISSCTFSNTPTAIQLAGVSSATVRSSTFSTNVGYGVANYSQLLVDARQNWWGHTSGPLDNSDDRPTGGYYNPTGQGVQVTDRVNYNPWTGTTQLPNPSVVIQEGTVVSTTTIHLQLSVGGPVTQMRISESLSFPGSYEPYAAARAWTLSSGDGLKTVYAQFRSADGSVSNVAEDTVLLNTTGPSASIAISSASPVGPGTVQISLTASEVLSELPLLTLTPFGQTASTIALTTQNFLTFNGSFTISTNTGNGQAAFAWRGVDLSSAVGTELTSGATFFIDTVPPPPPQMNPAVSLPAGAISLSWVPPAGEASPRYTVYRATSSINALTNNTVIAADISTTTLVHTPAQEGLYYFAIKTRDLAQNLSDFSNVVSTGSSVAPTVTSFQLTPPAPVKLGPVVVVAQFSEPMNTSLPVHVVLLASGAANGIGVSSTSFNATTWAGLITITTNVPEGLARIVFSGGGDQTGTPLVVSTFTFVIDYSAPAPPSNVGVTELGNGRDVRVSWTESQPNSSYTLFRSTNNQLNWQSVATNISTSSAFDAPPAFSTGVFYAVTARDAAFNESTLSLSTGVASPFAPYIVSPVNNSQVSSSSVTIGGLAQRGTTVKIYSSTGTLLGQATTSNNSEFSVPIILAQEGNNDIYAVAQGPGTNSSPNGAILRLILDSLPLQPGAPQAASGDTTLLLSWPPNTEPDILGYWIYRDGNPAPLNPVRIGPGGSPQFQDLGLTNGRSYSYRVSAEDTLNQIGPKSVPINAAPQAGAGWTTTP